jgi:WD40-like Beta Propeller Repeat
MKKIILLICCFVAVVLLSGCAGSEGEAFEVGMATQTPAPAATSTPVPPSPTPRSTSFWRIVTSTITPTLTPFPSEVQLTFSCLEVERKMPDDANASGVIALEKYDIHYGDHEIFLLDLSTGEDVLLTLPDEKVGFLDVSPSGKYATYPITFYDEEGSLSERELIITDAEGQRLKSVPWKDNWTTAIDWYDVSHLLIGLTTSEDEEIVFWKSRSWIIFDPFSGEEWVLEPDTLPGWREWETVAEEFKDLPGWIGWESPVYDPSRTLAMYPRIINEDDKLITYDLWDVSQQQLVTSLESILSVNIAGDHYPRPDWSLDGSQFVIVGGVEDMDTGEITGRELFLVTRDGQVEQLTQLGGYANVWTTSHSWSPDGRYIALYINSVDISDDEAHLAVLDTETLTLTDYCVKVHAYDDPIGDSTIRLYSPAPIWSPDGTQILAVDRYLFFWNEVTWVDLEHGIAAGLIEGDRIVEGWMLAPEE